MKKLVLILILVCFIATSVFGTLPVYAQNGLLLPAPGTRVLLSPSFNPPLLKGIKVHPNEPLRLDFILDQGDCASNESLKLVKYFLAALTTPSQDLWVNLSPYEKNRIVPESFGQTEMGRDLLAQDYMLKQITASLIYPEDEIGKKFWRRVYEESTKKFGSTNIPINTFNKVWIIPEKAVVYENTKAGTAYVVESKLKVMLEEDYLAASIGRTQGPPLQKTNAIGSQIVREVVIPALAKEINQGKNFAQLRQVYNSLILATWYKKKIKDSILNQVYSDKNKTSSLTLYPLTLTPQQIYQDYIQAFKKGAYNYIKETNMSNGISEPRKYFAGGFTANDPVMNEAMRSTDVVPNEASRNKRVLEIRLSVPHDAAVRPSVKDSAMSLTRSLTIGSDGDKEGRLLEWHIDRHDPYTITPGIDVDHFAVTVAGKTFDVRIERRQGFGKVVYYFEVQNQKYSESYIYTLPTSEGKDAVRGLYVCLDMRGHRLGRFMTRFLLEQRHIQYVHKDVRNAVLLNYLRADGFKPVRPIKPNAYYLERDLTDEEVIKLGDTKGTYQKGRRAFISPQADMELLSEDVGPEIFNQYVATEQLDVIAQAGATELYLGSELHGNNVVSDSADQAMLTNEGGIDFKADKVNVEVKGDHEQVAGSRQGIQLHIDPAMLEQFRHAPGLVPVITGSRIVSDLRAFLTVP